MVQIIAGLHIFSLKTHSQPNFQKRSLEFSVIFQARADEQSAFPHVEDKPAGNPANVRAFQQNRAGEM